MKKRNQDMLELFPHCQLEVKVLIYWDEEDYRRNRFGRQNEYFYYGKVKFGKFDVLPNGDDE